MHSIRCIILRSETKRGFLVDSQKRLALRHFARRRESVEARYVISDLDTVG